MPHVEARWPDGECARLRIERSTFEPWPGTLCCVFRQDTFKVPLSTRAFLKMATGERNAGHGQPCDKGESGKYL